MSDFNNSTIPVGFWFDKDGSAAQALPDFSPQEFERENVLRSLRGLMICQIGPLSVRQINQKEAKAFIEKVHKHHSAPAGWKFGVAVGDLVSVIGLAWVGRPVSRKLDDSTVLEVNRLCLLDNCVKNVPSMLYGKAARVARELGYKSIVTYTLESESGDSLKASGWTFEGVHGGGSWSCKSRPREDHAPTTKKRRWRKTL